MKFLRSRTVIHVMSAIASAELLMTSLYLIKVYSLLYPLDIVIKDIELNKILNTYVFNYNIWWAALGPILVGVISEVYDYTREHPKNPLKNLMDFLSWCFGACVFIAIELLKRW